MIRLIDLLLEINNQPKAIFLAGSAGGGKSSTYKSNPKFPTQLDNLLPSTMQVINVDDTYEDLLKKSGLGMKQKDFTPDELAQAAKLMGQAQKTTREKYNKALESLQNIIIDGTSAASGPILKKKQQLEDLGYKTLMIMIYVSPLTSLKRNAERDRSLMPSIVLRTWRDVNQNIGLYKNEFGENFILINNNPEDANLDFSKELVSPYFQDSKAKSGKEKSPEEIEKKKKEIEQMNQDIEQLVKNLPKFDSIETAKSKIQSFLK
jgi:predicted kinase